MCDNGESSFDVRWSRAGGRPTTVAIAIAPFAVLITMSYWTIFEPTGHVHYLLPFWKFYEIVLFLSREWYKCFLHEDGRVKFVKMSEHDRKSCYEKEELDEAIYGPNNDNSLYSNGTLHYCSIYR